MAPEAPQTQGTWAHCCAGLRRTCGAEGLLGSPTRSPACACLPSSLARLPFTSSVEVSGSGPRPAPVVTHLHTPASSTQVPRPPRIWATVHCCCDIAHQHCRCRRSTTSSPPCWTASSRSASRSSCTRASGTRGTWRPGARPRWSSWHTVRAWTRAGVCGVAEARTHRVLRVHTRMLSSLTPILGTACHPPAGNHATCEGPYNLTTQSWPMDSTYTLHGTHVAVEQQYSTQ